MGSNDISRDSSQKRFLVRNIASRVTQGLEAFEDNLRLRRKKLKLMFDEEENELFRELKLHEKLKIDLIIQMQRDSVETIEKQKAQEREALMAQKKLQLEMAKCKDIQPLLRRHREIETQHVQQQQMKEMQDKRIHEKEINNMWYYIMKNDSETKREKEEREIADRLQKEMDRKKCLDAQVQIAREMQNRKDLIDKEETDRMIEGVKKKNEIIETTATQKCIDAKMSLKECLKMQICSKKETTKKQKEDEQAIENSLAKLCFQQQQEEIRKKIAQKENQKRQLESYGMHATAIKAERVAREKAEDLMVMEVALKRSEESEKQRNLLARKSKALLKEALMGRDAQMEDKKKEAEAAAKKAAEEVEIRKRKEFLLAEQWKMEKERDTKAKAAYKQFLEEQMELSKIVKEQEKSKLLSDFKSNLIKEKEFNEKMVQLMKHEFTTEGVHPFMKALHAKSHVDKQWCPRVPETAYLKY